MNLFEWSFNNPFNSYYDECCKILKIDKFHNEQSLKEAYHKKVLETHPDKGGSTEDFIKVKDAYKFLNSLILEKPKASKIKETIPNYKSKKNFQDNIFNKNKKKISVPNNNSNMNNNINLNSSKNKKEKENQNDKDILKEKNRKKPKNVTYKLEIELSDAYFGTRKIIKLNRNRICKTCSGNNQLNVTNDNNINCEECNGRKYSSQLKELQLIIKPGTYNGCKVNFKGEGEEYVGYEPGDIIFEIFLKENKNYLRKGSDLYIYKNLSIGECLGIDKILINLFDKIKFYANKNKILINPGETKTIIGKGFPFFDDNTHRGNLHIKFNFSFPLDMKPEQKNIIKNTIEGNYMQYIKNNENNRNSSYNNINKSNINKKNISNIKKNEVCIKKPVKKNNFAHKFFNIKIDNKKQNEKNKNQNNNNNLFRSKSEINKSLNKKQENQKNEKDNLLNNIEIYELLSFEDKYINKGYFYEKNK